jgi:hypothetical protein
MDTKLDEVEGALASCMSATVAMAISCMNNDPPELQEGYGERMTEARGRFKEALRAYVEASLPAANSGPRRDPTDR